MTEYEAGLKLLEMYEKKAIEKNQEMPKKYKEEKKIIELIMKSKSNDSGKDLMYAYFQNGIYTFEKIKNIIAEEK